MGDSHTRTLSIGDLEIFSEILVFSEPLYDGRPNIGGLQTF